jgi:hypothetical protein
VQIHSRHLLDLWTHAGWSPRELATPKQQLVFKAEAIVTRKLVMRILFCSAHVKSPFDLKAGVQRQYMVVLLLLGSPGMR